MSEPVSIADYGLIADCHGAALVSREGAVDWCCIPRFDAGSIFGRLLDPEAGTCTVGVDGGGAVARRYVDGTLVLETVLQGPAGEARLLDCMPFEDPLAPDEHHRALLRVVEGVRGAVPIRFSVVPRFDYGEVAPWIRHHGRGVFSAIGGNDGLLCLCDAELAPDGDRALAAAASVRGGERVRLLLAFRRPEELEELEPRPAEPGVLDAALTDTVRRWREWSGVARLEGPNAEGARRSAIVIKALSYSPTGAMVAAPTTSLPGCVGVGDGRTWDYRYAWIRDSVLASECLVDLGYDAEAGAFARFIERSAAGSAGDLRVFYGVGGERRLAEERLDHVRGFHGIGPVRVGNDAGAQLQLDAYGHLVRQSWRWCELGHPPDDDYWRFLLELVDAAAERWPEPDHGIWEWRGEPRHFVHSKVMCWVALDRGLALAERCLRKAPERRWRRARDEICEAVLERGFDAQRGTFVQAFDERDLDAAVLRLPVYGFLPYDDERMLSTVDVLREALDDGGLLRRHDGDDGLAGREGAFVACSFWLVETLSGQGRYDEARATFDRALAAANDLGLFAEQVDARDGTLLGNFPQALTHLSHVEAALSLAVRSPSPQ